MLSSRKTNKSRRFPGESNRCRPDLAETRRLEAQQRQEQYDGLTPQQRLEKLDIKFGPGQGAKKERAKLQARVDNRPLEIKTLSSEVMQEIDEINDTEQSKKRLKAKDRRAKERKTG